MVGGAAFVLATATVTGSATLPNGSAVAIAGSFSAAESADRTTIQFEGRQFEFTPFKIIVDGVEVEALDTVPAQLTLSKRSEGVALTMNGKNIQLPIHK